MKSFTIFSLLISTLSLSSAYIHADDAPDGFYRHEIDANGTQFNIYHGTDPAGQLATRGIALPSVPEAITVSGRRIRATDLEARGLFGGSARQSFSAQTPNVECYTTPQLDLTELSQAVTVFEGWLGSSLTVKAGGSKQAWSYKNGGSVVYWCPYQNAGATITSSDFQSDANTLSSAGGCGLQTPGWVEHFTSEKKPKEAYATGRDSSSFGFC